MASPRAVPGDTRDAAPAEQGRDVVLKQEAMLVQLFERFVVICCFSRSINGADQEIRRRRS